MLVELHVGGAGTWGCGSKSRASASVGATLARAATAGARGSSTAQWPCSALGSAAAAAATADSAPRRTLPPRNLSALPPPPSLLLPESDALSLSLHPAARDKRGVLRLATWLDGRYTRPGSQQQKLGSTPCWSAICAGWSVPYRQSQVRAGAEADRRQAPGHPGAASASLLVWTSGRQRVGRC